MARLQQPHLRSTIDDFNVTSSESEHELDVEDDRQSESSEDGSDVSSDEVDVEESNPFSLLSNDD